MIRFGNHWLRNALELAARAALVAQAQPSHDVGDALDLTWLPTEVQAQAANDRDVAAIPFIVVHVTAVRGGYGVSRQLKRYWRGRLDDKTVRMPEEAALALADPDLDDPARLLGLWDRYRRTIEYHRLVSHPGQQYRVHPLEIRTPHAGPHGNDGVGFSIDQHPSERCEGTRAKNAIDLLLETADEMVRAGHPGPIPVTAHRCVAPPSWRGNDPGANVWRGVVMPAVAHAPELLTVDYEFKRGKGLWIPKTWDPHALYDAKGRPIARAA